MKPWDIKSTGKKPSDSFTIPLWAQFKPKDFYFAIEWDEETDTTLIYIVPGEYYEANGQMYPDSMPIVQHLPDYLEEIFEGVYEASEVKSTQVQKDMLRMGFTHNYFFQNFIQKHKNGSLGAF